MTSNVTSACCPVISTLDAANLVPSGDQVGHAWKLSKRRVGADSTPSPPTSQQGTTGQLQLLGAVRIYGEQLTIRIHVCNPIHRQVNLCRNNGNFIVQFFVLRVVNWAYLPAAPDGDNRRQQ